MADRDETQHWVAGYQVRDQTALLIALPRRGAFGPGVYVLGAAFAALVGGAVHGPPGVAMALVASALLFVTLLFIRPIVGVAVERGTVVLLKRRYPSSVYSVPLAMSAIAELVPSHVYGAPSLTLRMRSGPSHTIALTPGDEDEPAYDVLINRSGVAFPGNTRDGAAMARALTEVIRDQGMQGSAS